MWWFALVDRAHAQVVFDTVPRNLPAGVRDAGLIGVGDLDGDGWPDVVLDDQAVGYVGWYTGTASGFAWAGLLDRDYAFVMALVDLDGDGDLDLLLDGGRLGVNDGAGGFTAATLPAPRPYPADVDGDGDLDLFSEGQIFENLGGLRFAPPAPTLVPDVVLAGDFDGDGDVDVQSARALYLGDGTGRFTDVGGGSTFVRQAALVDLDLDGDLDLLRQRDGNPLQWLENNGAGLGPFQVFPGTESAPRDGEMVVTDVDGDGLRDVVTGGATVYRGLPGGGLASAEVWGDFECGASVPVDVDHDGAVDLLCGEDPDSYTLHRRPAWYKNAGFPDADQDGVSDATETSLGTSSSSADSDGDGLVDAAELEWGTDPADPADAGTVDRDHDGASDGEELLLGTDPLRGDTDGDGSFDALEGSLGTDPLASDTDGDGFLDGEEARCGTDPLSALSSDADCDGLPDRAEAFLGTDPLVADTDGDGLTDGREIRRFGSDPRLADTDGGGVPDGWDAGRGGDPTDAGDDWMPHPIFDISSEGALVVADGDGDGDPDAWMGDLWFENAGGAFTYQWFDGFGDDRSAVAVADADQDGVPDVFVARDERLSYAAGPLFTTVTDLPPPSADTSRDVPVAVDVDGDGDPDALFAGTWGPTPFVNVAENQGDGTFTLTEDWITPAFSSPSMVTVADLDGDGRLHVVLTDGPNFETWRVAGVPTLEWADALEPTPSSSGVRRLELVDLDADGDLDAVWTDPDGLWRRTNQGLGTFSAPYRMTSHVDAFAVGDLDGDGDGDLIVADGAEDGDPDPFLGKGVAVLENDGAGSFELGLRLSGPRPEVRSLAAADVDGDGDLDVLVASGAASSVEWLENPRP